MSCPILLFYPYNQNFTGGPRVVVNLANALTQKGFSPVVMTQKASPLTDELQKHGLAFSVLAFPDVLDVYGGKALTYSLLQKILSQRAVVDYSAAIAHICQQQNIQVVWGRGIKAVILSAIAAKRLSLPLIWDIGMEKESKGLMRILHGLGLLAASAIVTEGASQPRSIFGKTLHTIFASKFRTISPGISVQRITALQQAAAIAERQTEPFCLLSVATISPRKNQLTLIQAIARLREKYSHIHLDLVGPVADDAYFLTCQAYVKSHRLENYVCFGGWQENVADRMGQANLFVLTSHNEGIPYVIHEAMHAGLPVLATPVGGIPDVIKSGETGWLVQGDCVDALVAAIEFCMLNPQVMAAIARRATQFAAERLSAEAWAAEYALLLKRLAYPRHGCTYQ